MKYCMKSGARNLVLVDRETLQQLIEPSQTEETNIFCVVLITNNPKVFNGAKLQLWEKVEQFYALKTFYPKLRLIPVAMKWIIIILTPLSTCYSENKIIRFNHSF